MAGIFGLFDYTKEGPGVSKNAPKKHTFFNFFEVFFRNFWKFISINLLHSIISLPILTNGIAAVGITNITRNTAREKHTFGISDFIDTIKKNWKQALAVGIINVLIYAVLIFDLFFFYPINTTFATVAIGIVLAMLLVFTLMNYYIWTLMITFNYTIKQIYKNSFKFVFLNFWKSLLCFVAIILVYAVYAIIPILFVKFADFIIAVEIIIYLATFPCFKYLLVQFCTFPAIKKFIIDPYYEQNPDLDIQKRLDLGLEVDGYSNTSDFEDF
ncbi:MAG: DUF624 domain-containing protein [Ruminococcaceae bacterium]|nr:DUF624 domain-containing protein [Oscillospiraceae bacterium]